jgi:serine/threonine protein phosphatase 1
MALYAIGDIHGTLTALKTLFKVGNFSPEDTFIFLGDYVDRGPDSKGVIDWLLLNAHHFHFVFLRGNHEIMMLDSRESTSQLSSWLIFGGAETLDSYGTGGDSIWQEKIGQEHWGFLEQTKAWHQIDDLIFVHAGFEPGVALREQDEHDLFWKKYITPMPYEPDKTVICGHTSRKNGEIANFGHTICIDTFAYGGQWLTCLNVHTMEYIQANEYGDSKTGKSHPTDGR